MCQNVYMTSQKGEKNTFFILFHTEAYDSHYLLVDYHFKTS